MVSKILMDLLLENPYYGYLAGRVQFVSSDEGALTRTTFQNGPMIHYNELKMEALSYEMQKGVVIHELLHLALLHFVRGQDKEPIMWHMACDMAVSELMDVNQMSKGFLTPLKFLVATGIMLPERATAETYYQVIKKNKEEMDYHYDALKKVVIFKQSKSYESGPLEQMDEKDIQVQALVDDLTSTQIASLAEEALSKKVQDLTEIVYKNYKVNWRDVLKRFLAGQGRVRRRRSYKRTSRRYEGLPGIKRDIGVKALVAIDESGSVSNHDVKAFQEELMRINGIQGADISVLSFDTVCSKPQTLSRFVLDMKRQKRGGTDFRPVFEVAEELKVPLLIIFTDGQGEAPAQVNQKVLWVLTTNGKQPVKYGKAIHFTA